MNFVLLAGFEPFGGGTVNASQEIVRRLDGAQIAGHVVRGATLPCEFGGSIRALEAVLRAIRPALVLCLGQAGGRTCVTPELVALNRDDAAIPDNAGYQPVDVPVVRGGPPAYWSTLPVKAIVAALQAQGIPAEMSRTAGGFVCNHVFYGLMYRMARRRRPPMAGFIHVPPLADGVTGLALEQLVDAVRTAIAVSAKRAR